MLGVNASAAIWAAFLSAAVVIAPAAGAQAQAIKNAGASDEGDIYARVDRAAAAYSSKAGNDATEKEDVASRDEQQTDDGNDAPVTLSDILARNEAKKAADKEASDITAENEAKDRGDKTDAVASVEKPIEEQSRTSGYAANPFGSIITSYASAYGVPEALAHAVVRVESNFRPKATGAAGEIGLMQLKLGTARMMGYSGSASALYDPETNIKYGMKYLAKARQLSDGSTCGTILKYNAGHGAKRMNPISANYCQKVASIMN